MRTKKAVVKTSEPVVHHQQLGDLRDGDVVDVPEAMDFSKETLFAPLEKESKKKKVEND